MVYDPGKVSLDQLMKAFFYVIDPTVENRQGNDIGTQYQTGIYFADEAAQKTVEDYTAKEREKHDVFAVEVAPLSSFFPGGGIPPRLPRQKPERLLPHSRAGISGH